MPKPSDFKLTLIGLIVAILLFAIIRITGYDLFEAFVEILHSMEHLEVDELIIPMGILVCFFVVDLFRKNQAQAMLVEKTKIYRATIFSTNHVLNNFLNQMQMFKIMVEDSDDFPEDAIDMYDKIIQTASAEVKALSSVTSMDEVAIKSSVLPKPFKNTPIP